MSNYKQSSVAGDSWVRAVRVVIENPVEGTPAITFCEETVVQLATGVLASNAGNVSEAFTSENYGEQFVLRNPETGEPISTATYQDVYVMLHSLYIHAATKRDAAMSA